MLSQIRSTAANKSFLVSIFTAWGSISILSFNLIFSILGTRGLC